MIMARLKITWEELEFDIQKLIKELEPVRWKLTGIYGIPRGGLAVAILLSYRMNIPLVLDKRKIGRNTLIVDDIADSGKTLQRFFKLIRKKRENFIVATVWYSPRSKIRPDYYINVKEDKWLIFPWETLLSSKIDNTEI